jgi:hypothetical protein
MGTELKAQTTVCPGVEYCITLDSMRGTIQWQSSLDGGTTYADINGETSDSLCFMPTADAFYRAVLTTEPGCDPVISDAIDIQVSDLTADAGADQRMCEMDSVMLGGAPSASGGAGGYTYNWLGAGLATPTGSSTMASPTATTDYVLEVTDTDGCMVTDTVNVLVDLIPASGNIVFPSISMMDTFVVARCIDSVFIECWGADGNSGFPITNQAGQGGFADGSLLVGFGDTLWVFAGGKETRWNGGGLGGASNAFAGGDGGGASDVRQGGQDSSNRMIIAGGGGGAGSQNGGGTSFAGAGGHGGGFSGGAGSADTDPSIVLPATHAMPGTGAATGAGGNGGAGMFRCSANADAGFAGDSFLAGGAGGPGGAGKPGSTCGIANADGGGGGGGGGGYAGGGGGGGGVASTATSSGNGAGAGGGGGSSFLDPSVTGNTISGNNVTNGPANGRGQVIIHW